MAATFDGPNLVITLESGQTQLNVQQLYSDWKSWLLESGPGGSSNRKFAKAFDTSGGEDLTPGLTAGAYFFIRNDLGWRIRPPEENITIFVEGNLAPADLTIDSLIPTIGNFNTAILGLQPITQNVAGIVTVVNALEYNGAIHLDEVTGTAGTTVGENGTIGNPCNSMMDAKVLADATGFRIYEIRGRFEMTEAHEGFVIQGIGSGAALELSLPVGQTVDGTEFRGLSLFGDARDSLIRCNDCLLPTDSTTSKFLTNCYGYFHNCGMGPGPLALTMGVNASYFISCHNLRRSNEPAAIQMTSDSILYVRRFHGDLKLDNMESTNQIEVGIVGGTLQTLDADNPASGIVLTIFGNGCHLNTIPEARITIDRTALIDAEAVHLIAQMTAGNISATGVSGFDGVLTVYDTDKVTPLATYNISNNGRDMDKTS